MKIGRVLVLIGVMGMACMDQVTPPPSPPPPSPPPPPPNQPPVAVIVGGPYSTSEGTVQFDGSASSDPDGHTPLTYRWTFGDGTNGEGAKPTHTYANNGTYNVGLTVTDALGLPSAPAATTALVNKIDPGAVVFSGAGNIATCGNTKDEATAALLSQLPGFVFTTGDNVFRDGTLDQYTRCYEPSWGRHRARTHPALGNHDYSTGTADGSFDYWGDRLGERGKGYYSFDLGAWHVVVLNDNIEFSENSEQLQWLRDDLRATDRACTMAIWHGPITIYSGRRPIWDVLYAASADVVVNGHPHYYERLKPLTPAGVVNPETGIRQFSVGTGGESVSMPEQLHPHSEATGAAYGVLTFTLRANGYDWEFLPIPGDTFRDSGSGTCH